MRLQNVNAVITGASSGIGQAVASRFRREGANLLLTGRRPEMTESPPGEPYLPGDLNDENVVAELAARAEDHLGDVGVVVLCHGFQASSPIADMTYDDAREVLHSNLLSAFLVMKHMMPLASKSGASMVCVSSRLGMVGMPDQTMYSAAKGGLIALARGAAIEWADRGIRVNVVAPGLTVTPVIEASFQRQPDPAEYRRAREDSIPIGRLADAVLFLACPESSYITGAVLPVDGGYTAF
ncbi:SDR family NAD(P)-dependent oxidoreductase [Streptomyces sp. NPDC006172]|uniref:SDR family NAD(P)-dependent oxidoreductase n=1 Tax=Streptomyces sp. NPDC006172 TaxID=3154470 RepID=UPI0033EBF7BB